MKELYGKVSTSKYANVTLRAGRPRPPRDARAAAATATRTERDPARVEEDVREGYVTPEAAARDYDHQG